MKNVNLKTSSRRLMMLAAVASGMAWPLQSAMAAPATQAVQQAGVVKGQVLDQTGEPVIGATVRVKGTQTATVTDLDGNFRLNVHAGATLEVTFIGFKPVTVKAGTTPLTVKMEEDGQTLNDLVVVGYGTMRKKDLTGSVIQIKPDNLQNQNPGSVQDILRGNAGLNIGLSTSAKGGGSMEIRGQRSISGISTHDPLLIVDGMIFYGELSEINPDDIGQIDVLKDASAAAVYGAKAASGVIIITTKKGKKGKPTINVSANFGFNQKATLEKRRSADSYVQMYQDYYKEKTYGFDADGNYTAYVVTDKKGNLIAQPGYYDTPDVALSQYGVDFDTWKYGAEGDDYKAILGGRLGFKDAVLQNYIDGKTYDWYDGQFRTGLNQDYNASISGASEKMNYYLSVGYVNNESAYRDDNYSAVRANMKLTGQVTQWLEIGANVMFQDRQENNVTGLGSDINNSPYGNHTLEDGSFAQYPHGDNVKQGSNWDFNRQYWDKESGVTVLRSIFNAKVNLPFNITYQFNIAPSYSWYYNRYFTSASRPDTSAKDRGVDRNWHKWFNWSLNNTVTWDQTFAKKHHVVLTLVQEAEEQRYWSDNIAARYILPSDALGFHNTQNGTKDNSSFSTSDSHQTADALMARLFYSYDDRYMMTLSVRRDGYSAFGASNPHATFPSIALAWNFANEKFWKWQDIMSTGKLRVSWGKNGNRSLSDPYISLSNLGSGTGSYAQYLSDGSIYSMKYLGVDRMANPYLKWEKTASTNLGLDFGFLNDRITGSVDVYNMKTEDMVMNKPLPGFSGFGSIATNIGEVDNTGFEVSLMAEILKAKDFSWNASGSLAYNKNKIKHLFGTYEDVTDADGNVIGQKESDYITSGWFIGKPIGVIWDYKVEGIWQVDEAEEAAKYGQRPGDPKVWNNPDNDEYNEDGSLKKAVYNDDDKVFQGNRNAPWRWSLRNELNYKNFTLSFNFYSIMGFKRASTAYMNAYNNGSALLHNFNNAERPYWTPENPSTEYGRIDAKGPNNGQFSPNKWYNSSFIRLENISIGYTLPKQWLARTAIENLKVYGNIRNVCQFGSDWKYGDPETGGYANRVFSLGISATL